MGEARLSLLAALLLLAAPAAAQAPAAPVAPRIPDEALISGADPARVAALLKQIGYLAELGTDQAGDPRIETGFGGTKANIWFYDCEPGKGCLGLQLQVGVVMDHKLSLAEVNRFNQDRRFASLALDEDDDPILRQDVSLVAPGVSAAVLADTIRVFEDQVRELMLLVQKHENRTSIR